MKRGLVVLPFLVALSACIPWPHYDPVVPDISGVVTNNGVPVGDVTVYVHTRLSLNSKTCPPSDVETVTDSQGRFRVSAQEAFSFFVVIGDPAATWAVCLANNGVLYPGWRNFELGYAKPRTSLSCELTHSISRREEGQGVCREHDAQQGAPADAPRPAGSGRGCAPAVSAE